MIGFGEPEAPDDLARGHPRQPGPLLLLAAEAVQGVHGEGTLHGDQGPDAGVGGLEFETGEAVLHGAGTGAPVSAERHPERPDGAELARQLPDLRQLPALVPLGDLRQHPVRGPVPHGVTDREILRLQQIVDPERVGGVEGGNFEDADMREPPKN